MATVLLVSIDEHFFSSPSADAIYAVRTVFKNGGQYDVLRRYSQFVSLHNYLHDPFTLPSTPEHDLDNDLVVQLKAGLVGYLNQLNLVSEFQNAAAYIQFLTLPIFDRDTLSASIQEDSLADRSMPKNTTSGTTDSKLAFVAAAYYPAWSVWTNPSDKLRFDKFDILFFAFSMPNASSTLSWENANDDQDALRKLVSNARRSGRGTKIVLSVGGWGGSQWFSNAVRDFANREKFKSALVEAVDTFGLDGIDIDWEYPNSRGAGNPQSPSDAANFLSLLKLLRTALGPSKIISAAVAHLPWFGPDGKPLTDVSQFAEALTYLNIMNYDVNGASPKPGPNAPLGNPSGVSKGPQPTARSAFIQWTKAGFPASKLLLGLPLYGYVSKSTATELVDRFALDPADWLPSSRGSTIQRKAQISPAGDLSAMWGQQIAFNQLVLSGALKKTPSGTYMGGSGYVHAWDDSSNTPFLYNVERSTVVTYDDTWSIASKTQFAKNSRMAGCFTWSLDQDDGLALQNVIRANLGK